MIERFLLCLSLILISSSALSSQRDIRLDQLKEAQSDNSEKIALLRSKIQKKLNKMMSQPFDVKREEETYNLLNKTQNSIQKEISTLKFHYGQVEFWDRLLFETERKYTNGSYKEFLEKNLFQLAQREVLSAEPNNKLWKKFAYASWVVKNACDPLEEPVLCLRSHLSRTKEFKELHKEKPAKVIGESAPSLQQELEQVLIKLQESKNSLKTGSHNHIGN